MFKLNSASQWGAILASYPVAIVKQLFMGPWSRCIIHATLQPVWRTYRGDIHEWANRSIVNHNSIMGSDWRTEAVLWFLFSLVLLCFYTSIPMCPCLYLVVYVCLSFPFCLSRDIISRFKWYIRKTTTNIITNNFEMITLNILSVISIVVSTGIQKL